MATRKATGQVIEVKGKRGRSFAIRFRAHGRRHYLTLGSVQEGWTKRRAEEELANVLADVRRATWQPAEPPPEVEVPRGDPTFHEFASEWFAARQGEWRGRTPEDYRWTLTHHLLPHFARKRLSEITVEDVDRYKAAKVREGRLSSNTTNKTLVRLAQILDVAVEYGYIERNPARGRNRRLKPNRPRRASLSADQVETLLQAAGKGRTLLATAILAGGLRVSEITGLRWRDVNLATGTLTVEKSKTDAGVRVIDLDPGLIDELKRHKQRSNFIGPDDYVFPGRDGKRRDRNAVRRRLLYPAIERANVLLAERGLPTIPDGVTFHSLRRTYASLAAEAGVDPAWTARQIGHTDPRFTISVYTDTENRRENPAERVGSLVRMGSTAHWNRSEADDAPSPDPPEAASERLNSPTAGA